MVPMDKSASAPALAEAVAAFRLEQRARGVSPHTLRAQDGDLGKLLAHAAGNAWAGWEVAPRTLRRFALELGERGLDPASQARILSTVRGVEDTKIKFGTPTRPRACAIPSCPTASRPSSPRARARPCWTCPSPGTSPPRAWPACWNCSTPPGCGFPS